VVGPRLRKVLVVTLGLFALTSVNSFYLGTVTFLQWVTGHLYETPFYHLMAFAHIVLGALLTVPAVVFGVVHGWNARDRRNRRAVRVGQVLFAASLALLGTGFLLVRLEGFAPVKDADSRALVYWAHVVLPFVVAWLYVLHRLAGKRIQWKIGARWAVVGVVFAGAMAALHAQTPRTFGVQGPASGEKYFFPSLARTDTGNFIPQQAMRNDAYCLECHQDVHREWSHSAHRFSSFNNPVYLMSVRNTRKAMMERHGDVTGSRWCAGCHDPVPFFSGAFDDPRFDDPDYDLASDPLAQAGITCTVCHAITNVNSTKGNADFTIEESPHYPFAYSSNPILKWINRQMILAKPGFHKATFLKPLHKTAEFCATCHKVHLPPELNDYKWLRGQNHYDTFLQSGVSGHGITSFYYPPVAETSCNRCHLPLRPSEDFGSRDFDGSGTVQGHDHMFPAANTGIAHLLGLPGWVNDKHRAFLKGTMRVDLFGVREGGTIDGTLHAPLRPKVPALEAGASYLLEAVIRTLKLGHPFTQGTADSNEIWLEVTVRADGRVIGRSGGRAPEDGEVDPWSHFVNAFVIDREGRRIDRRNPEDIFVPLYNNQIPPGAGQVVHYRLVVPEDVREQVEVDIALQYRKFDTTILKHTQGEAFRTNDLPITTLATDRVVFPVVGGPDVAAQAAPEHPAWQRWNDYGIGLLLKGGDSHRGQARQAEEAFAQVEALDRADGPLNLARVYLQEGRLEEAAAALDRAGRHAPPAPAWSVAWFSALVSKQNGFLDDALERLRSIVTMDSEETRRRGFDFTKDTRVLNELGQTLFERAKQERGPEQAAARRRLVEEAAGWFEKALAIDAEDVDAHYNLALVHEELGDGERAAEHRRLHARYKPDDNARDAAVAAARRRYPAADHAAEVVVLYDLHRDGAYDREGR
jgi:Tfp pilus assembly protein PilF